MGKRIRINGKLYEAVINNDDRTKEIKDWWDGLTDIQDDLEDLKQRVLVQLRDNVVFSNDRKFFKRMSKKLLDAQNALTEVGTVLVEIDPTI